VLYALTVLGWDQPGNYILGEQALRSFLEAQRNGIHFLEDNEVETEYPLRAIQALNYGVVGSSAAGEFSKFTARRLMSGKPIHVIVKFSGSEDSPQEQRWSDYWCVSI